MFENKCAVISKKKKKIIMLKKVDLCHFTKDVLYKQLNNKTVTQMRLYSKAGKLCDPHQISFFLLSSFLSKQMQS